MIEPKANERDIYLPEGDWIDFWTNERHGGKQDISWKNPAQPDLPLSKIPVFVRSGAIVPLILGDDIQTLCDANYVNNAGVKTWDGGLEVRVYPAGDVAVHGLRRHRHPERRGSRGNERDDRHSPTARPVLLRVLAPKPAAVRRDGTARPRFAAPAAFDAAARAGGSMQRPGFVLVKFAHPGGTTQITF